MNKHPLLYNLAVRPPGYSHIFCLEDKHTDGTKALKYQTAQEINEEKTNQGLLAVLHVRVLDVQLVE